MSLAAQIKIARLEIRKLKLAAPYLYPQWHALKEAELEFERAKRALALARVQWRAFGRDR